MDMVRWGMPSSSQALFQATKKRADKLEAKGKPDDFPALLKAGPDAGTTKSATRLRSTGRAGLALRTAAWCRLRRSASGTAQLRSPSGSLPGTSGR